MTKTTLRRLLPVLCAGILLTSLDLKPAFGQDTDTKTPPIELKDINIRYAIPDAAGNLVWKTPDPKKPNVIPSTAQKLGFTAKVANRPAGSRIRVRLALQELCSSPDAAKPYLAKLRHLTEIDQEVEVINPNDPVSVELPVHCDDCVHAVCGCECPDKDHLGEGPHLTTLTVTDTGVTRNAVAAKPASFRMDIKTVCPKKCVKPPSE